MSFQISNQQHQIRIIIQIIINNNKSAQYVDFTTSHIVQPIAVENLGPIN